MNLDLSINRMAFRETDSLAVAQALVVKKRNDLELRRQREQVIPSSATDGTKLDNALRRAEAESRASPFAVDHAVDKTA